MKDSRKLINQLDPTKVKCNACGKFFDRSLSVKKVLKAEKCASCLFMMITSQAMENMSIDVKIGTIEMCNPKMAKIVASKYEKYYKNKKSN